MLLDTYTQVFLWVGEGANKEEKEKSSEFAANYVAAAAVRDGRDANTCVVTVAEESEPMLFTCHFLGWDEGLKDRTKVTP